MSKEIKTVSLIGLGAVGILTAHRFAKTMPRESLKIIADKERIDRYRQNGVYANGEAYDFNYVLPEAFSAPADLIIFAVKYGALNEAVEAVRNQAGPNTLFLSLLNGITSEEIIAKAYSKEQVVYAVAQGMDALCENSRLTFSNPGTVFIGDPEEGVSSEKVRSVAAFFEKTGLPYAVDNDIVRRMWGKFMLNVGINQAVAVFGENYGSAQNEGQTRDVMIAAMREVIPLAQKNGINISEADLPYWFKVIDSLYPESKPSMRQDVEARRYSEVEMLSGAVLAMSEKYSVKSPVNEMLYRKIKEIEATYTA